MTVEIIRRKDAMAQGLKRYFTGKPCKSGHISERNVASTSCLECGKGIVASYRERHPDRVKELQLATREKSIERTRRWYYENTDRIKEYKKLTALRRAETQRQWARKNPNIIAARAHKRRAAKAAAGGSHTASDLAEILSLQGGRCAYCRIDLNKIKRHVDHIIPLARKGSNSRSNLQFLCQPCNHRKSSKDPIEFAQTLGMLL